MSRSYVSLPRFEPCWDHQTTGYDLERVTTARKHLDQKLSHVRMSLARTPHSSPLSIQITHTVQQYEAELKQLNAARRDILQAYVSPIRDPRQSMGYRNSRQKMGILPLP